MFCAKRGHATRLDVGDLTPLLATRSSSRVEENTQWLNDRGLRALRRGFQEASECLRLDVLLSR